MITKKKKIQKILKSCCLNLTPKMIELLIFLENSKGHPSVLEIWEYLKDIFPSISKTTVYNILDTFVQLNILKVIHVDNSAKYDFNLMTHGHFICKKCGAIFDVISKDFQISEPVGPYKIEDIEIYFKGVCENCLKEDSYEDWKFLFAW